jgi:3-demethoxyubiquinol 3-hydroxylase
VALSEGDRFLRVDHAGEHGAVSIYKAQLWMAMLRAPEWVPELTEFLAHEIRHRSIFGAELARRGVAPCRSWHLCGAGGFALGLLTGLLGRRAIAATTVAVEQVVLRHLDEQIRTLGASDPAARVAIERIVADEREHHDRSARHLASPTHFERAVMALVRGVTEAVIWLGMRL